MRLRRRAIHNLPIFTYLYKFPCLKRALSGSARSTPGELVSPQALESASSNLYWWLGGLIGYVLFAVIDDAVVRAQEKRIEELQDIEPHSAETGVAPTWQQTENVVFHDGSVDHTTGVGMDMSDGVSDAAFNSDATLDTFFARPVKIASYDWLPGSTFNVTLDPWTLFWEDPKVYNRIVNYRLLRCTMRVKFVINGNSFYYGRLMASYRPLDGKDGWIFGLATGAEYVAGSQRPHLYINPTTSTGGEMTLPFFYHKNALDVYGLDWREMGVFNIADLNPLKNANGATDKLSVSVFAWAENVSFAIPTNSRGLVIPQADEYSVGPVQRIATNVARIAKAVTPMIGPFAKATELGASAVSAIAALFGFSSPTRIDFSAYRPLTVTQFANTNAISDATKLTLDAKQELTIDPRTVGLSGEDELSIQYIASKESYLDTFAWAKGTVEDTLLWNAVVEPGTYVLGVDNKRWFPALGFVSLPFKYWRGSLVYRFQFVTSGYHKGRVRLVYDPVKTDANPDYNGAYTTIVDIGECNDFEMTIGWGQDTTFRETSKQTVLSSELFNTSILSYDSQANSYGNGTLAVYVVNELTTPNSTVNNDIEINVFVSGGPDFELAGPDMEDLEKMRLSTAPAAAELPTQLAHNDVVPQAAEGEAEIVPDGSAPVRAPEMDSVANKMPEDNSNHIYFGEKMRSLRQMAKRFTRSLVVVPYFNPVANTVMLSSTGLNALPAWPGYRPPAGGTDLPPNPMPLSLGFSNGYLYGYTSFLSYISGAYLGWRGGVRYAYNANTTACTMKATRMTQGQGYFRKDVTIGNIHSIPGMAAWVNAGADTQRTGNGQTLTSTINNPVLIAEVPFYSRYRMSFPRSSSSFKFGVVDPEQPGVRFDVLGRILPEDAGGLGVDGPHDLSVAAGEDFNLFFFVGAPPMYYEVNSPTS